MFALGTTHGMYLPVCRLERCRRGCGRGDGFRSPREDFLTLFFLKGLVNSRLLQKPSSVLPSHVAFFLVGATQKRLAVNVSITYLLCGIGLPLPPSLAPLLPFPISLIFWPASCGPSPS